ncbi:MAG: Hsp20/alpha crystallin family protein [Verrucomicrobiae bacterium]|nr:Hsp20/alpha crystallin family protein [Verrucomicrobiae bacterium]
MKYLTRRYPNNDNSLWGDFEAFFNAPSPFSPAFNSIFEWEPSMRRPAIDLYEDDGNYYVQAELPGFDRKEIEVELEQNRLVLKGARKVKEGDKKSEITFNRAVTIPDSVLADKVSAKYDNGVLTVTIPKAETAKPLRIEVKS